MVRRKKMPIRRRPSKHIEPGISIGTENERIQEDGNGRDEEAPEGIAELGCENPGNREELVNSDDNSSVEGDDCAVIVEDRAGYKEAEPSLQQEDNEFVDIEVGVAESEPAAEEENNDFDDTEVSGEAAEEEENNDEFVDVEVGEDRSGHFRESVLEDGNVNYVSDEDNGYDMWDDDHIPDPLSDDDREEAEEGRQFNFGDDEFLALGKTFNNAEEFKNAVLRYSLKTEYDIRFYKSSSDRLGAKCTDGEKVNCPWRVYCSFERGRNKLMVKVFNNEHICARSGYTKLLNGGKIAQLYEERLRVNPKIRSIEMVAEIKREYNMIVSEDQCRRAKLLLSAKRKAVHEAHFARLWDYQEEVLRSNMGSTMEIETIPGPTPGSMQRFYRLYVCFEALKSSWKQSCRPIIGLDAAFMKWDVKGQMLAAVGRDGDNRIFPIAWAVVDVEDNPNWLWFVQLLKKDLRLEDGTDITIISDKHKGLLNAVHVELPKAEHRMCARHILDNWKKTNKDIELERLFWKIARSYTPAAYLENLEALKKYNLGAFESLKATGPETWSRAFFKLGSCCNDNLNNLSESFNRSVRESRRKPLLDMLTEVRRKTMVRNAKRTVLTKRWKKRFTPRADTEIELNRQKARECKRYLTTGHIHEIEYHDDVCSVNMEEKTCGCGYWQLNGLPCMHAMCVITTKKLNLNDYVSSYYLTSTWRRLYATGMKPVQGMNLWPRLGRLPILPPPSRFNRGRPNGYARKRGPHESASNPNKLTRHGRVFTCSNCKKEGHTKTRCPNPTAVPPAKRPRGRPRKYQGESSAIGEQASQTGVSQGGSSQGGASQSSQGRFGVGASQSSQGRFGFSC